MSEFFLSSAYHLIVMLGDRCCVLCLLYSPLRYHEQLFDDHLGTLSPLLFFITNIGKILFVKYTSSDPTVPNHCQPQVALIFQGIPRDLL